MKGKKTAYINHWYCDQQVGQPFLKKPITIFIQGDAFVQFVGNEIPEFGITIDEKSKKSETGYWPDGWRNHSYTLLIPYETQALYMYVDPETDNWAMRPEPESVAEAVRNIPFLHVDPSIATQIVKQFFPNLA